MSRSTFDRVCRQILKTPPDVLWRIAEMCDGHGILDPRKLVESGMPETAVNYFTDTLKSDGRVAAVDIIRPLRGPIDFPGRPLTRLERLLFFLRGQVQRSRERGIELAIVVEAIPARMKASHTTAGPTPSDELIKDLCMHISAIVPEALGVTEDQIPAEIVEKEKQFALQEAIDSGKPKDIAEKMVVGKMRKYMDSIVLLRQPFIKDDKQKVQDILPQGITIKAFKKIAIG